MKAGINLYSLRDIIADETGLDKTFASLKEMGYSYLQVSGTSLSPQIISNTAKKYGLDIHLTHSPMDRILNDTKNLCGEHDLYGAKFIGIGSGDRSMMKEVSKAEKLIRGYEEIACELEKYGKTFMYHNHSFEFAKMDNGQTFYDYMIENTVKLKFIFDTYWVQMGGVSIEEYIKKLSGRIDCVHLKDFKIDGDKARFAALGDGNINFQKLIALMKECGVKYFFVEQDDACSYENPLSEVRKSIDYLSKI